jgi:NAD(P)-dependent dehydrogenase (short-subunit alcohol dehydrogenase family)
MEAVYQTVKSKHGRLDVVVADAGVGDNAPLGKISEQQFDKIIGTNLKGVLFTVQAALPLLRPGASIIIIGSTASIDPPTQMSVYGASKAGVRAFVSAWIKDMKGSGSGSTC